MMKKLMKNSIGAFPNMSMMMTMFNQLSDLDVSQQFGFRNQENNNQTQILMKMMTMNNFSRYFDVLLMKMQNDAQNDDANLIRFNVLMFVDEEVLLIDITNDDDDDDDADFLKITTQDNVATINKTAKKDISNMTGASTMINMNIPLLKTGSMLMIVGRQKMTNDDGALSVTIDNKLMDKNPTLMAILTVVFNNDDSMTMIMMNMKKMMMMMKVQENTNSNNKKLTNNCKIEINTDNINFSHCCDDEYETIFNVSVFLSQKLDIMMQTNGSVTMMMINQLQSHFIQSFIVNEHNDDANTDDDDDDDEKIDILTEPTSTTSQSNTNKSEYAFERTLNNFNDDANVAKVKIKIIRFKLNMMESTTKLFSFMQCWCPSFDDDDDDDSMVLRIEMEAATPQQPVTDEDSDEYTSSNDDDDAGYMMISDEMQLCHESLLQSFKESDQQSGIVSNNSCNTITKLISTKNNDDQRVTMMMNTEKVKKMMVGMMTIDNRNNSCNIFEQANEEDVAGNQPMNISELIFSHINDKNDTLIVINADNTVNITCDFNYLNYKIKHKINDQIHKDNASVKDKSCYNNTTTNEEESNTTTTTNNKDTSSLVDKKKTCYHQDDNISQTTVAQPKGEKSTLTQIDELIECQRREKEMMRQFEASGRRLRLCGGGEGSLSGASGWGSPPSNTAASNANNNNNPNAGQWGATAQQTPQQNWSAAQQAVGGGPAASQSQQLPPQNPVAPGQPQAGQAQNPNQKPLTPGGPSGGWNQPPQAQIPNPAIQQQQVPQVPQGGNGAPGIVGGGTSAVAAKNQLEQLNSMREALFAQDGWGCQNVNQDTNWDVPGSPEPGPRTGDPAVATQWKSHTINNGTELWEANLRNGGQPPPQPVQKTPWNHTPTSNIGGTWGEDDDGGDNAWAGNQSQQAPGWNQGSGANPSSAGGTGMWPATPGVGGVNANIPKKDNEWAAGNQAAASNWGDPRDSMRPNLGAGAGPIDVRNIDPRDPRAPGNVDMRMMDTREQMQGNVRGVTGRLNGSTDMWQHGGMSGHGGQVPGMNKIVGPGAAAVNNPQWPGSQVVGPKDIDMNKPGWGDSSPPAARRPMGADDGTSLWGSQSRGPGVESNWKGAQDPRNNFGRNPLGAGGVGGNAGPGFPPNRLPGAGMKPEGNTWSGLHPGGARNSWDDPHTPNWEDKSHLGSGGLTPWNEGPSANPIWNKNKPSWPDNNDISNEWPQQNKLGNASSEIIRSSKQFRILVEGGFKKDDAEIALRSTNMSLDEAMELLQQQRNNSGIEPWHHGAASGAFDHSPFPGNRYPGPQTMPFPPNNPKLPNSSGAGPGANIGLNNLPMQLNKHLPHQAGTPAFTQQAAPASQSGAGGAQPSAHHLRNLVQQIQKAVQAGYLNHQILNQPLAPQTLQLLNSLLNTIQQLQYTQQSIQRNGGVNSIQLQMTIQKQKQQISQLQSQIAQQQNLYIKSQGAGSAGGGIGGGNEFLRQNSASSMGGMGVGNHNDSIVSLENNLAGLGLKQEPSPYPTNTTSQQSRLNQWKLPSALDNKAGDPVDFSRAPGTTSKQSLPPTTPTSISSIGIHNEAGTWSTGRNDAGGWPDSTIEPENKDWPASNQSPAFTDLVPEFQPGKPWKGTQKNIEDDPSITPGSVARNPLSISAAKESDLFGSNTAKTSPNEILSSSTWSFNPSTSSTQQNFSSTKLGAEATKTNSWSDSTSDLWAAPSTIGKTTAGPPPGLGASKNGSTPAVTSEANDWIGWNSSNTSNSSGNGTWFSTWLLLKNLTAQIDGSTLRTLCVQHGPLQHFHLYLNHGIALCKYSSREEASKAQQALNNCVLSNTTICAESPSESEVQNILQHLGVPSGSQGNGGNGNGATSAAGSNASTWRPPSQQGPARSAGTDSTWGSSDWPTTNSTINW